MTRSAVLLASVVLVAACSPRLRFKAWEHPRGQFLLEVPAGWAVYTNIGTPSEQPVPFVIFVGEEEPRIGEERLGAQLAVHSIPFRPELAPELLDAYRRSQLDPLESYFGTDSPNVSSGAVAGLEARFFSKSFTATDGDRQRVPMKVRGAVVRAKEGFFLIEYRANTGLFDRYAEAFDRATASFRLR